MANVFLPATSATAIGSPVESGWGLAMRAALEAACPAGTVGMFVGPVAPDGWILLQGQTVNNFQTTYPTAWANMPSNWKSGSSGVFPDTRARIAIGAAGYGDMLLGGIGGLNSAVIPISEMPAHSHGGATVGANVDHQHYFYGEAWTNGQNQSHQHYMNHWHDGTSFNSGTGVGFRGGAWNAGGWGAGADPNAQGGWYYTPPTSWGSREYTDGAHVDHQHYFGVGAWTGTQNQNHLHGIYAEGGGAAHSKMQAHFVITFMLRVY